MCKLAGGPRHSIASCLVRADSALTLPDNMFRTYCQAVFLDSLCIHRLYYIGSQLAVQLHVHGDGNAYIRTYIQEPYIHFVSG